jgi:Uma2 family endonuclease
MIQTAPEPLRADLGRMDLRIPPAMRLDDDLLFALCQANRELRIERNAYGDLEIMPPTGAETGARSAGLTAAIYAWAERDGRGVVFDSSTGFLLPNGAMRSPDLAWVLRERLSRLSPEAKRRFLPLVPDLIVELASPTDDPAALKAKMGEWQANGVRLGWLIFPDARQVWSYVPGEPPQCLADPPRLADETLLPGLALPLARTWEPGL